ncbi:MAG: hypothetical protein Q8O19_03460 [Rectinemataceae bacterium]|nr:hypothetical protein [Rectinemataceae bacterium]
MGKSKTGGHSQTTLQINQEYNHKSTGHNIQVSNPDKEVVV